MPLLLTLYVKFVPLPLLLCTLYYYSGPLAPLPLPHAEGRLSAEAAMRDRVSASGCCPSIRCEVWKWLLGMYPRGSTAAEREAVVQVGP